MRSSFGRWSFRSAPFLAALLLVTACASGPRTLQERPDRSRRPPKSGLAPLGFSLQVGAFSKVELAARCSNALQAQGLDATYFGSEDGFFRVRFGNFATKAEAWTKGEALRTAGVIESFWVIAPTGTIPMRPRGLETRPVDQGSLRNSLVKTAKSYLGVPYLFGGTQEQGFDCSGLTGAVYRLNGLQLPRTSQAQFEAGTPVELGEAHPGDLVFFGTGGSSRVSHVGMLVGPGAFIHAPRPGQGIRLDDLSDTYFRRHFLGARSYF